jgi:putative AdoMet-dependent methyltransferase
MPADAALFDDWADDFDAFVAASIDDFPFAGYAAVLDAIVAPVVAAGARRVLDLGIGTGAVTDALLAADPALEAWGIDFSPRMLAKAAQRAPGATLIEADLAAGLAGLPLPPFDAVVTSYVLHEFPDEAKADLLVDASGLLEPGGVLVVGDIAFPDDAALRAARERAHGWDESEHYAVAEAFLPLLAERNIGGAFQPISWCAGVFILRPGA